MSTLKLSLAMIFNPISTVRAVQQNRGNIKVLPAWLLVLLMPILRILSIFTIHYPLSSSKIENVNFLVEIATSVAPILLFMVASFLVTSINDGETLFSETVILSSYCLMPYIIFTIPIIGLSWLFTASMADVFSSVNFIIMVWSVLLTFLVTKETNQYSLSKAVVIYVVIILTIILLLAVLFLVYALANQLILFFVGLFSEIGYVIGG